MCSIFMGSCTGGKLYDLAQAASVEIREKAEALGYLEIVELAGTQILKSVCRACINSGLGVLAKEETFVYATNRNFKGRSGDPTDQNYLASPRTVAILAAISKISHYLDEKLSYYQLREKIRNLLSLNPI